MNAIETYLDKPETHQLYGEGFSLFSEYRGHRWPKVFEKLSVGPMGNNKQELLLYLRKICSEPLPGTTTVVYVNPEPSIDTGDYSPPPKEVATELTLQKRLKALRQKRARASQSFHSCKSDEERAGVCDQIADINQDIKITIAEIEYFRTHGRPKAPEVKTGFILSDDMEELTKRQNRLRSNILKVEKRIEFLLDLPEKDRKRKQIPKKQDQLREMYSEVEAIVQKRNKIKKQERDVS